MRHLNRPMKLSFVFTSFIFALIISGCGSFSIDIEQAGPAANPSEPAEETPTQPGQSTTPAALMTSTASPTPPPHPGGTPSSSESGVIIQGLVQEDDGPFYARQVKIYIRYDDSPESLVAVTNSNGYFNTDTIYLPSNVMVHVRPEKMGMVFNPQEFNWLHEGGVETKRLDFQTFFVGPTPTTPVNGVYFDGYVLSSEDGPGLPNARILARVGTGEDMLVNLTDSEGYFTSADIISVPGGETVTVWTEYEGKSFDPPYEVIHHQSGVENFRFRFIISEPVLVDGFVLDAVDRSGLKGVKIYYTLDNRVSPLLWVTDEQGYFTSAQLSLPSGAEVTIWPELPGFTFEPREYRFTVDPDSSGSEVEFLGRELVPTPVPPENLGLIVYENLMNRDQGNSDIMVMRGDGTGRTNLTDHPDDDEEPSWSPDKSKIAFASDRDGDYEIFLMNADGTGVTQLTDNDVDDRSPTWSPDGARIAFASYEANIPFIFVIDVEGTDLTNLTQAPGWESQPSWSPDGEKIAFVSSAQRLDDIFIMDADGENRVRLTDADERDFSPAWSPDGLQIAFVSERSGTSEIYIMNADGSEQTQLTFHSSWCYSPTWSPDGMRIAYISADEITGSAGAIYVIGIDGLGQMILPKASPPESAPDWR